MEQEQILDDIILIDDAGEASHFSHIITFMYEGERYIALEPIAEEAASGEDDDEAEVVLLHIVSDPDGDVYEPIENEILLNEVFDEFLSIMDEAEES